MKQRIAPKWLILLAFAAGIGIGVAIQYILPYWKILAYIAIMWLVIWYEFRRK